MQNVVTQQKQPNKPPKSLGIAGEGKVNGKRFPKQEPQSTEWAVCFGAGFSL